MWTFVKIYIETEKQDPIQPENAERYAVEALNHHFISVGPKLANQIEQNSNDDPLKHIAQEESALSVTPIDCSYVRKAIQRPKNGKAPGPDKIPKVLIKDVTDLIHQPLTMIFNSSSSLKFK